MKKYLVRFTTKSGDYDKEWTYANSPHEAADIIKHEHRNVQTIDAVTEL